MIDPGLYSPATIVWKIHSDPSITFGGVAQANNLASRVRSIHTKLGLDDPHHHFLHGYEHFIVGQIFLVRKLPHQLPSR